MIGGLYKVGQEPGEGEEDKRHLFFYDDKNGRGASLRLHGQLEAVPLEGFVVVSRERAKTLIDKCKKQGSGLDSAELQTFLRGLLSYGKSENYEENHGGVKNGYFFYIFRDERGLNVNSRGPITKLPTPITPG